MRFCRTIAIVTTLVASSLTEPCHAAIDVRVNYGERLAVDFHLVDAPAPGTDTLVFAPGSVSTGLIGNQISLYDGDLLLGTVTQSGPAITAAFRHPSSPWVNGSAIIDFSSILALSIDGRIEVTPQFSSSAGFVRYIAPEITTVDATGQNSFVSASRRYAIIDSAIAIPEPTSVVLIVAAVLCVVQMHRVRWFFN
jgi:hypothetical protein